MDERMDEHGVETAIPGAHVAPSSGISPKRLPFSLVNSL